MATHDWYVDPSVASDGDGTKDSPFKSLTLAGEKTSRNGGDVNRVFVKAGAKLYEQVPTKMSQSGYVGLHMDIYDGTEPATIDATVDCTEELIYDSNRDWYMAALGTNDWGDKPDKLTIGAVFQNDVPLPMQIYTSDHVALRAKLEGGGYASDWITGMAYVVPFDEVSAAGRTFTLPRRKKKGKPDDKPPKPDKPGKPTEPPAPEPAPEPPPVEPPVLRIFRVATRSNVMSLNAPGPFGADTDELNYSFKNIRLVGAKRHGVEVGTTKFRFERCFLFGHGGQKFGDAPENHLGNGIEIAVHADDGAIVKCDFNQIYDSSITTQVYGEKQYVTNVLIEDNDFACHGLAAVEISNQAGSDARVEHIKVLRNRIHSNRGCFAPDIYGGRYAGVTIIYNVKTGVIDYIDVLNNDIEDQIHNGLTITECGDNVHVDYNNVRRCETGVFFGPNAGNPTKVIGVFNTFEDCKTAMRVNGSNATASIEFTDTTVSGGEVAVSDGSSANVQIKLFNNILDADIAIDATRTEGITGRGNTSTGEIDPKYYYLFEE
jgi:hypothetical protein